MFCYLIIMILAGAGAFHYVFRPLIEDAVDSGSRNAFTKDPNMSLMVLTLLASIIAPVTLVVLLVPTIRKQVKDALVIAFNE